MRPRTPWWRRIPCWFGFHRYEYTSLTLTDPWGEGEGHALRSVQAVSGHCRRCEKPIKITDPGKNEWIGHTITDYGGKEA